MFFLLRKMLIQIPPNHDKTTTLPLTKKTSLGITKLVKTIFKLKGSNAKFNVAITQVALLDFLNFFSLQKFGNFFHFVEHRLFHRGCRNGRIGNLLQFAKQSFVVGQILYVTD